MPGPSSAPRPGATEAALRDEVRRLTARLQHLERERLEEPDLRRCLYPGCAREFDARAARTGARPARPGWSAAGWRRARPLPGYICPDHEPAFTAHLPYWHQRGHRWSLICRCGWRSRPLLWRPAGIEDWKDHLLTAQPTTTPRAAATRPGTPRPGGTQ